MDQTQFVGTVKEREGFLVPFANLVVLSSVRSAGEMVLFLPDFRTRPKRPASLLIIDIGQRSRLLVKTS
jgi:hypothetical protein